MRTSRGQRAWAEPHRVSWADAQATAARRQIGAAGSTRKHLRARSPSPMQSSSARVAWRAGSTRSIASATGCPGCTIRATSAARIWWPRLSDSGSAQLGWRRRHHDRVDRRVATGRRVAGDRERGPSRHHPRGGDPPAFALPHNHDDHVEAQAGELLRQSQRARSGDSPAEWSASPPCFPQHTPGPTR